MRAYRIIAAAMAAICPAAIAGVIGPPASLNAPAFYKKYVDADGIPVLSSALVPDTALYVVRDMSKVMLSKRPDVRAAIIAHGGRIGIMAKTEVTTDIPEHANLYTLYPGTDWNTRARGLGGTLSIPMSTCAEENVLGDPTDPYIGESIFVHEFAHGIYNLGVTQVDATFAGRLQAAYTSAIGAGLWANTYAGSNVAEYWAEGVQSFFQTNLEAIPTNGIHNAINTRAELQSYDPGLYALVAEIFAPAALPWQAPGTGSADQDNDGIPDAIEGPEDTNRFVRDNDVFTKPRLFAMQQYRDFLAREGDAGGVNFWVGQLAGAQTRAQTVESFFNSNEFQGTIAPVARLYFAYFLRIPDYGGLNFWIGFYRAGNSLQSISNNFAGSPEFQSSYGALNNGQFVDLVYQNVLGRLPDAGGRAYWKGQLDSSTMTRGQVMTGFSESPEYRTASDSMVYVTMMYYGMLRRAPDGGGFNYWVGYRNAGNSGIALIEGFLASQEYRSRFLP